MILMKMFTDNPVTSVKEDKFDFALYAHFLSHVILHTEPLPVCVGIFGAWGSGKSSLMKMIQELLPNQSKVESIWFNPWKYDKREDLWNALIQTILYSITKKSSDPKLVDTAKNLALATTWLALKKAITTVSAGVITEANLDQVITSLSNEDERYSRHINNFEADFKEIVEHYTDGGKLVIFIDDLDRCLPENAITVLESLKLFIGDAHCIFVLGMDHFIVEEGIRYRYPASIEINGRDYLDKIIQIPFFLPPVSHDKLRASFFSEEVQAVLPDEIWNIACLGTEGNPRKMKRFVNCFQLLQHLLDLSDQKITERKDYGIVLNQVTQNSYLAKLLIFQMSFPDFYLHLQLSPDSWRYLEEEIIQADSTEDRQQAFKDRPELKSFWEKANFQAFMRKTTRSASLSYPVAPPGEVVSQLLRTTNLVTKTGENPISD